MLIDCACGCGKKLEKYDSQGRSRKAIYGHHMIKKPIDRFLKKIKIDENKCWIWQGCKLKSGHGQFSIMGKKIYAHRFSYQHYNGDLKAKQVNHKCGNGLCVNPEHLYLGNQIENMKDLYGKSLSKKDKEKIKKLYENGTTQTELSKIYDINQGYISRFIKEI